MTKWSESQFIKWVREKVDQDTNILGHDEDAVATKIGDEFLVVNIDGWVASTDRPDGLKLDACAYRAVANAVSDVIVKGAQPDGMIISASVPVDISEELENLVEGIVAASQDFAVPYLGGDLNKAKDLVLDVTVWGRTKRLIRRSGAQVGDNVYWLGPSMGSMSCALGILTKGWIGSYKKALSVYGKPKLYPEFVNIPATAAIDSSDGVAKSLYLLASSSRVGIKLDGTIVIEDWAKAVALKNELKVSELLFYGGEELGVVFTAPANSNIPDYCTRLGSVIKGDKIWLGDQLLENKGWEHFS